MDKITLSPAFAKTLKQNDTQTVTDQKYTCQSCYRRNLTQLQVRFHSHGESYCVFCAKEG